jgi:hypothetical protein
MVFAITGIAFRKYYVQSPVKLIFYLPMASDLMCKLRSIGKAGKKIPVLNSCNIFDRPAGTDTAESVQPRPLFPALKPCKLFVWPCLTLLDAAMILGNPSIFRFSKAFLREYFRNFGIDLRMVFLKGKDILSLSPDYVTGYLFLTPHSVNSNDTT